MRRSAAEPGCAANPQWIPPGRDQQVVWRIHMPTRNQQTEVRMSFLELVRSIENPVPVQLRVTGQDRKFLCIWRDPVDQRQKMPLQSLDRGRGKQIVPGGGSQNRIQNHGTRCVFGTRFLKERRDGFDHGSSGEHADLYAVRRQIVVKAAQRACEEVRGDRLNLTHAHSRLHRKSCEAGRTETAMRGKGGKVRSDSRTR